MSSARHPGAGGALADRHDLGLCDLRVLEAFPWTVSSCATVRCASVGDPLADRLAIGSVRYPGAGGDRAGRHEARVSRIATNAPTGSRGWSAATQGQHSVAGVRASKDGLAACLPATRCSRRLPHSVSRVHRDKLRHSGSFLLRGLDSRATNQAHPLSPKHAIVNACTPPLACTPSATSSPATTPSASTAITAIAGPRHRSSASPARAGRAPRS